jgi:mycothiol synthase
VTTAEEIAHWLGLPRTWFWAAERDGAVVGYADAQERSGRTKYWFDLRGGDAEAAEALLHVAEELARARATAGARILGQITSEDHATRGVYESSGYRLVRYGLEMRAALDEQPPAPAWPEGLSVRTYEPGRDDRALYEADEEAFADHWEHVPVPYGDWRAAELERPDLDPSLVFLAEEGDELAGFALCLPSRAGQPIGWVEVLGVRRRWRRRGLALALLRHAFRAFRARGLPAAGLEVDAENLTGAVRLYERAGMRPVSQWVTYEKTLG